MLNKLKFVSVFPTIQGEGINCGKSTTFILYIPIIETPKQSV